MSAPSDLIDEQRALEAALSDAPKPEDASPFKPMTDEQLRHLVSLEISHSLGEEWSRIASDQQEAVRYYFGKSFGNEKPNRSKVVLRDVADTIDWIMPALMRMMFYTSRVVQYGDVRPEDEERGIGRQMTLVVNELFREQLRGFQTFHDWFKGALLHKNETLKVWAEERREPEFETYEGLTVEQLALLLEDAEDELEIVESTVRTEPVDPEASPVDLYDVRMRRWRTYNRVRMETIPPEDFLIERRARRIDEDTGFVADRSPVRRSTLIAMGFDRDRVMSIPIAYDEDYDGRKIEREAEEDGYQWGSQDRPDLASQMVWFYDVTMRVDFDGDGYAEMRRVLCGGSEGSLVILWNDYASMNPYCSITPNPMPHRFHGRSAHDAVGDLQFIRSTLLRQILDNIYTTNNPRHMAVPGVVDIDTLLNNAPGGVVLTDDINAIKELPTAQLSPQALQLLEWLEGVRQTRTGAARYTQDTFAQGQNQTATGVSAIFEAAQARIQIIGQIFAETGIRELFRKLPRVLKDAGIGQSKIKIGDEWVEYNPQEWPDDLRVTVHVGLSPGQTEQRIQRLMLIMGLQEKAAAAGWGNGFMVDPERFFNTAERIVEEAGFRNSSSFFLNPAGKDQPQQPPDPKAIAEQAKTQMDAQRVQLEAAKLEQKAENDRLTLQLRQRDQDLTHQREMARIEMEREVRLAAVRAGLTEEAMRQRGALAREEVKSEHEDDRGAEGGPGESAGAAE